MYGKNNKSLHNGFATLVKAIENLTDQKIDLNAVNEPIDMDRQRRLEARLAQEEISRQRIEKHHDYVKNMHERNEVNPKWVFENIIKDQFNLNAVNTAMAFCLTANTISRQLGVAPPLLLLQGGAGTGKTVLSHCIANKVLHDSLCDVEIRSYSEIKRDRTPSKVDSYEDKHEKSSSWERLLNVQMLIIDGICENHEGFTPFDRQTFPELLRERWARSLPLVITTPVNPLEIQNHIGSESYESIKDYNVMPVALMGQSRRRDFTFAGTSI